MNIIIAFIILLGSIQLSAKSEKIIHPELRKVDTEVIYGKWSDWKEYKSLEGIEYRERTANFEVRIVDYEGEYKDNAFSNYKKTKKKFLDEIAEMPGKQCNDREYLKKYYPKEPEPYKVKKLESSKVVELPKQYEYRKAEKAVSEKFVSIEYDSSYYNPFATSFKWKYRISSDTKGTDILNANFIITDHNDNLIYSMELSGSSLKKDGYFYVFIHDYIGKKMPKMRFDLITDYINMARNYHLPEKYSGNNSVIFKAIKKQNADAGEVIPLIESNFYDGETIDGNKNFYNQIKVEGNSEQDTCNMKIKISVKFSVLPDRTSSESKVKK